MSATTVLLRDNPGLLVMIVAAILGAVVLVLLGLVMWRSGASLRSLVFVAGMFVLVLLPQLAFHLGVATGVVPRHALTWIPVAEQARVHGWVEREAALVVRDGAFADLSAVFGIDAADAPGSDLRAAGTLLPFQQAEAAHMVALPEGTAIVARFATASVAQDAARAYAQQALGFWPDPGSDGLRTATRPAGDVVKIAQIGRSFVMVSAADERAALRRLLALGAIAPAQAPADPGADGYWLYRPGVLPALAVVLVLVYVFAFFRGVAWAGTVPAVTGSAPLPVAALRERLLAVNATGVPLMLTEEADGRIVVTWRFADARWLDLARAHHKQQVARLILEPDPTAGVVRVTEQRTHLDADAGWHGASLNWRTQRGAMFFQVERGQVFGLQFDADGRPQPHLDYAWRFDAQEMKAPFVDAVTRAGWQWRTVPWTGPSWLRWLTG